MKPASTFSTAPKVYDGAAVYIDLLQVHWAGNCGILGDAAFMSAHPGHRSTVAGCVRALNVAVKLGKIRHIGVCNFGTDDLNEWALAGGSGAGIVRPRPVSNQLPYNPLWRAIEHTVLPRCREEGIGVLCYSSLQQGLLSGRFEAADEVPIGKRRTRLYGPASWSQDQNRTADPELGAAAEAEIFGKPNGVLETLRNICSGSGPGVAEASLAWLLSRKGVACIIVGASNPGQATMNANVPMVPPEITSHFTRPLRG